MEPLRYRSGIPRLSLGMTLSRRWWHILRCARRRWNWYLHSGHGDHRFSLLPAIPGTAKKEKRQDGPPHRSCHQSTNSKDCSTNETNHARDLQAPNFAKWEPKQTTSNLPTIKWKNREKIKNKKHDIDHVQMMKKNCHVASRR